MVAAATAGQQDTESRRRGCAENQLHPRIVTANTHRGHPPAPDPHAFTRAPGAFRYFTASHTRDGQLFGVTGGVTGAGCAGSVVAAGGVAGAAAAAVAPVISAFCFAPIV